MEVSAIQMCTVGVGNLDLALGLFRDIMKLRVEREGLVSAEQMSAWHLSRDISARYVELSCGGYPVGRLRLIQYSPQPRTYVRRDDNGSAGDSGVDVGPKALDFYVADPIGQRVQEIEEAGYVFRSSPVRHTIGNTESEECIFSGPDGVPVLIMVGHRHSKAELRDGCLEGPYSEIATISIVSDSLERSRAFYEEVLGLTPIVDAETDVEYQSAVNALTGVLPNTRIHFCLYAKRGEPSGKVLIVHFHDRKGVRLTDRMRPGNLGFSLMTHTTDSLEELRSRLIRGGYQIVTEPMEIMDGAGARRLMLAKGPNEELFEFVEAVRR